MAGGDQAPRSSVGLVGTFINILNSFFGSGVLGLPYAFRMSGYLAGLVTLISIALVSRYCMELLLRCRAHLLDRDSKEEEEQHRTEGSYGDIGEASMGRVGKQIVDATLVFTQTGFCCVYMIFLGNNLHSIFPETRVTTFVMYCMIALVICSWLRSLKWLSPFSLFAEVCTIVGLIVINVYASTFYEPEEAVEVHPIELSTFPIFFGIAAASYEGIGLVIPIQQSMKEPEKYSSLLNFSMTVVTLFFIITGLTSYFCFGQATESIITLNLPATGLSTVVKLTLCAAIFFTYPIQLFPVITILEALVFEGDLTKRELEEPWGLIVVKRNALRTFLVIFTGVTAVIIPHFGEVIGLIGSIGASLLAFILPAYFYLSIFRDTLSPKQIYLHYAIMLFGVLGGLAASSDVILYGDD